MASLASRGDVSVQLLYSFGITSTPPASGSAIYNTQQRGGYSGRSLVIELYGITLVPLTKKLGVADTGLLSPFYADNAAFDGLAR